MDSGDQNTPESTACKKKMGVLGHLNLQLGVALILIKKSSIPLSLG